MIRSLTRYDLGFQPLIHANDDVVWQNISGKDRENLCLTSQGVFFWIFQIVNFKIDVQIRPMEMEAVQEPDISYCGDSLILKIRIIAIIQKIFTPIDKQPYPKRCNIFNACRNIPAIS